MTTAFSLFTSRPPRDLYKFVLEHFPPCSRIAPLIQILADPHLFLPTTLYPPPGLFGSNSAGAYLVNLILVCFLFVVRPLGRRIIFVFVMVAVWYGLGEELYFLFFRTRSDVLGPTLLLVGPPLCSQMSPSAFASLTEVAS